jgi:hypothetical protein
VDQRQAQADRNRCKARRRTLVGGAEDHDQEHHRHHHLADQRGAESVATRRVLAIAVGCEPTGQAEPILAAGDQVQHAAGHQGADHLRHDVGRQLLGREAPACPKADRHRRIEVTAGDVADREGHRQHREAECQRHAVQPDADFREGGGEHGAAAAAQHQPEGPEELCDVLLHADSSTLWIGRFERRNDRAPTHALVQAAL